MRVRTEAFISPELGEVTLLPAFLNLPTPPNIWMTELALTD